MTVTLEQPARAATLSPADLTIDGAGLGPQLAPWAAMGCLTVAAGAARLAAAATGAQAETALTVAAVAFTTAVVAATVTKRRLTSRKLRHRLLAALYLGAAWLTYVTATGLTWGTVAALSVLGCGLSLLWWRENRIVGQEPAALLEPGDDDLYVTRWANNLGAQGRQLAGSKLTRPQIIKAGYRYDLELVPGVHTVEQVRAMAATLTGGLRLMPGQDIIVEVHPDRAAPTAVLTIVTRSPVKQSKAWPGPEDAFDPATGSVNLGPFVDGEGIGQWKVYQRDGMFGGYLQGAQGSGKSRMIESIAMACAASQSHPTVIWYGDGQHGSSSPLLAEHADWSATTPEAIYTMLQAAEKVMQINAAENRVNRWVGFTPTTARPGLLVVLDECHKILMAAENPLLAAPCQRILTTIAREGRKVGVALILASQSPTLDAFGGAGNLADTLRACLLAGNGIILRSETNNAKQVFNVEVNPRQFPNLPGYAYLARPEVGARSAPFRGYWVTDEMAALWPGRIGWRRLPPRQGNYAGKGYARRHEAAQEQAFADELLLQLADAGNVEEIERLERRMDETATSSVDVIEFGDNHPPVRRVERFWMPEQRTPSGLKPGQQKVLDAIRSGRRQPKDIREATGYSESQVYNLLAELKDLGLLVKDGYGTYQAQAAA